VGSRKRVQHEPFVGQAPPPHAGDLCTCDHSRNGHRLGTTAKPGACMVQGCRCEGYVLARPAHVRRHPERRYA
jgi:hypothetical protein